MICNQVLKSKLKGKTLLDIYTHTHTPANERLKAKPCNRQKKGKLL